MSGDSEALIGKVIYLSVKKALLSIQICPQVLHSLKATSVSHFWLRFFFFFFW